MIGSLITSQTRIKLLKKFFLNSSTRAHLRGLEAEFGESSNSIRIELNRLEGAGLLNSSRDGNKKLYQANERHPLFREIHNIILKDYGIDSLIERVVNRVGNLVAVYLTGDFARGNDSAVIEIVLVGQNLDIEYLNRKAQQAEDMVGRKVNYTMVEPSAAEGHLSAIDQRELIPLWGEGRESVYNRSNITI